MSTIAAYTILSKQENARSYTGTAVFDSSQRRCFYKECRSTADAQTEAAMLSLACSLTSAGGTVVVPEVYGVDEAKSVILLEQLDSLDNLFNYVWNQWRRPSYWLHARPNVAETAYDLGVWLNRFHAPLAGDQHTVFRKFADGVRGRLRAIQGKSPDCISSQSRDRIEVLIDTVERSFMANGNASVTKIHGDLNLSNLLVLKDGRLAAIDFADSRIGLGLEDFAVVYHNIWLTGVCRWHCRKRVSHFLSAFSKGYFGSETIDESSLTLFRVGAALVQLLSQLSIGSRRNHDRRFFKANRHWISNLTITVPESWRECES